MSLVDLVVFPRAEDPPDGGVHAQHREKVPGDHFGFQTLGLVVDAHRGLRQPAAQHLGQRLGALLILLINGIGVHPRSHVAAVVCALLVQHHQLVRSRHRQLAQQNLIDQREDRGVGADAQCQRQDRHNGEQRAAEEPAHGKPDVVEGQGHIGHVGRPREHRRQRRGAVVLRHVRFDHLERFRIEACVGLTRPGVASGEAHVDRRIVDDLPDRFEKRRRILVGQHAHVERRLRLGRNHVHAIAAGENVGRNGGAKHRRVGRLVVEEVLVRVGLRPGIRHEHVAIAFGVGGRRDRGETAEVGAGRFVQADVRLPRADLADRRRQVHDGVGPERDGSVPGDAFSGELDGVRNLLERRDPGVLHAAADARDAAALGVAVLRLDLGIVLVDHELNADPRAAFLSRFRQEDHVAIERDVQPLQLEHHHQRRGQVVLVVDRAAAIDPAAVARGAERRELPFRRIDVDDVAVADDEERPLAAVALQSSDHVGPVRLEREELRRNAFLVEHLLDVLRGGQLLARRIAGVEPQQRLVVAHRLFFERRPVRRLWRLSDRHRCPRERCRDIHQPSHDASLGRSTVGHGLQAVPSRRDVGNALQGVPPGRSEDRPPTIGPYRGQFCYAGNINTHPDRDPPRTDLNIWR